VTITPIWYTNCASSGLVQAVELYGQGILREERNYVGKFGNSVESFDRGAQEDIVTRKD
jgi:hypothetical protein